MSTPSLLLIPDRYKAGKLYSQIPDTGAGDLDFTRVGDTATRVNASGLIESVLANIPRIDFTGGGCGKLLLEPQRTNLLLRSEEFDNASWTKVTGSITPNASASPNGLITANLIVEPISDRAELASNLITTTAGVTYTLSAYGKESPTSPKRFLVLGNSGISFGSSTFAVFDLALGIMTLKSGSGVATIDIAENGFYRLTLTQQATASLPSSFFIYTSSVNNGVISSGGGSVIAWGCQVETGSFATSYIPTVAATVTRGADLCSKTGISSLIGQTEGTVFVDFVNNSQFTEQGVIMQIGTGTSRVYIFKESTTENIYQIATQSSGGFNFINTSPLPLGRLKIAFAYQQGNNEIYINGQLTPILSTNLNPTSFSQILFNTPISTTYAINTAALYTTRLSNPELQALTTL